MKKAFTLLVLSVASFFLCSCGVTFVPNGGGGGGHYGGGGGGHYGHPPQQRPHYGGGHYGHAPRPQPMPVPHHGGGGHYGGGHSNGGHHGGGYHSNPGGYDRPTPPNFYGSSIGSRAAWGPPSIRPYQPIY